MFAIMNGYTEISREFLKYSDIDIRKGNAWREALELAASNDRQEVVRLLLRIPEVDVNGTNNLGLTPFQWTVLRGYISAASEILKVPDIEINEQGLLGWTALMFVVDIRSLKLVTQILQIPDVDVNIKNNNGDTALSLAFDKPEILRLLKVAVRAQ